MLKSVFAKYVTTFMALLLASFLMLLFIVNRVVANDALRDERQGMQGVGQACAAELATLCEDAGIPDLAAAYAADSALADRLLGAILTNFEDMTVFVTDSSGGFIFSVGRAPASIVPGALLLPTDYFSDTEPPPARASSMVSPYRAAVETAGETEGGTFLDKTHFSHGESLAYARPILAADGSVLGHVLVTSTAELRGGLMNATLRSVAVAGLWIMLASLIAIYFITERIISPLREMSRAAKKLMVGQFDVRVRVHGRDEVAELAVAFNQMASELENLDRMRSSFVANVSHDLRTPMTTISGFIDGILDGVIPPEEHAHYLHVVSDEVRRLSRLVTALLDVSRLQAGDRRFDMQPFDICEMGRQILISFEQKIDARHLDVEFDCTDDRMYVLADRDAIHQILYNICDNAVKFSYEGGTLRMSFDWIEVKGLRKARVRVYNEGVGIPDEDRPFIFERFYKSDKSRSLDKTGVGLGMFIAKTIINAHNETISVSGEYGRSCEFTFTLARTEPPAQKGRAHLQGDDL